MFRLVKFFTITAFILAVVTSPALASKTIDGEQDSGAVYRIYLPDNHKDWNGELVVFAHSYVPPAPPGSPPQKPEDKLYIEGKYLPELFTGMGYAFAVTSYSKTGLAIVQGVADVVDLVGIFKSKYEPKNVYLLGVSQGGLVCTLALEQHPEIFSGGLSLCGPIGDFRRQINYWGDFRVVFDYFFPNLIPPYLPGEVLDIPEEVMREWESKYKSEIYAAISTDPNTGQLLSVTGAAIDPNNPPKSAIETVIGLLQYNVFATNDGKATLLGQPFDNLDKDYLGSDKDNILNREVHRFEADTIALDEIQADYQTSGLLTRPLVSMHTMLDPIVPYWHEATYNKKISQNGLTSNYIGIPVNRYGHVSFTAKEVLEGFEILVKRVNGD
jgi:pimeloyl-ACP methyl ester carboxylesterase